MRRDYVVARQQRTIRYLIFADTPCFSAGKWDCRTLRVPIQIGPLAGIAGILSDKLL
jgi:hypothetical protein